MAGMTVIKPVGYTAIAGGSGVANLSSSSPREIWVAGAAGTVAIDIDFGSVQQIDSFYLGNTNANGAATWRLESIPAVGAAASGLISPTQAVLLSGNIRLLVPGFVRLAAPISARFVRIVIDQPNTAIEIGNFVAGLALEAPYAFGAGRMPVDTSKVVSLQDGGFGIDRGVVKTMLQWRFPELDAQALARLWAIAEDRGESAPLVVVEGPDYPPLATSVHYGLFRRFEAFEREDPAATKWALTLEEWR
jgi:hypothetical protein